MKALGTKAHYLDVKASCLGGKTPISSATRTVAWLCIGDFDKARTTSLGRIRVACKTRLRVRVERKLDLY